MFDRVRTWVLRIMRVPHDPAPPFGAPGSIRVFRAGHNYYKLRLFGWAFGQASAVVGICFSIIFLNWLDAGAPRFSAMLAEQKPASAPAGTPTAAPVGSAVTPPASQPAPAATASSTPAPVPAESIERLPEGKRPQTRAARRANPNVRKNFARVVAQSWWALPLAHVLESLAIITFLVQLPLSYAAVRLNFEQHWYIVTDRSLRIRTGLWSLQESTMSFANLQQVEMKQGPLQRLLGLGDVHVQSAGGGGDYHPHHAQGDSLHTGVFHSVDNATEIRDLILARLRQFRQAGLGDHDDPNAQAAPVEAPPVHDSAVVHNDALAAAREILAEARALRHALS